MVVELSHEVAGGFLSLFFPFDPRSDGHGFRVSSLQLSESVGYCCYGGWVRVGCSLKFVESVCEVSNAFYSFCLGCSPCFLAVGFYGVFDVIPLVSFFEWGMSEDDLFDGCCMFLDLRIVELKRQMGDLFLFLLVSERIKARWSESDPILCVLSEKEGKIVGDVKM